MSEAVYEELIGFAVSRDGAESYKMFRPVGAQFFAPGTATQG
jgi:hypothetical protein